MGNAVKAPGRIIFEVDTPGWAERREFETVADLIDHLVLQTGEREEIAAYFLRGVLDGPEDGAVQAPRGSHLRAVPPQS